MTPCRHLSKHRCILWCHAWSPAIGITCHWSISVVEIHAILLKMQTLDNEECSKHVVTSVGHELIELRKRRCGMRYRFLPLATLNLSARFRLVSADISDRHETNSACVEQLMILVALTHHSLKARPSGHDAATRRQCMTRIAFCASTRTYTPLRLTGRDQFLIRLSG